MAPNPEVRCRYCDSPDVELELELRACRCYECSNCSRTFLVAKTLEELAEEHDRGVTK